MRKKQVYKKEIPLTKQPFISSEKGIHTSRQIKSFKFAKNPRGKLKILGAGVFGTVYLGEIKFQDGLNTSVKTVAIKRFNNDSKLNDKTAQNYQKVIDGLREVSLIPDKDYPNRSERAKLFPKAAMVKINIDGKPEWVMISQAFYSKKKGSKLKPLVYSEVLRIKTNPRLLDKYITEFCWVHLKVIEKFGCRNDVFSPLNKINTLVIDLDAIVHGQKVTTNQKAKNLVSSLNDLLEDSVEIKRKAAKTYLSMEMPKDLRKEFIRELINSKILLERVDDL